jgi:hypothetical protein
MHSHPERGNDQCVSARELLILLWLWLWHLILICLPLSQRPNAGVAQGAPRQGCRGSRPRPWMADGGGPPEQCRSEGMPSLGEAPNGGARLFGYFWLGRHSGRLPKGTRCKSETASSHYRRNGYVLHQKKSPDTQPSQASQLPQFDRCTSARNSSAIRPPSQASPHPH